MKKSILALAATLLLIGGCSSKWGSAGLGAAGGAAASAGGYEYHLKKQKDRIEEDLRAGRIDQQEYDIRMDQIRRDSLLQK